MDPLDNIKWASAIIGLDKYKTNILLDNHSLIADEPIDAGGQDAGPTPGDFLRISLASCTAITLRMYADRKGFDIAQIEVKVHTERTETKTTFHRQVLLTGNLDEAQRARMLQIANACPIHKVLSHPVEVVTKLL
jgi:putative redox protein